MQIHVSVRYLRNRKHVLCFYSVSSYRNTSENLGEGKMLWEHELQLWEHELHVSVSTAFLTSPKLSQVFLLNN